MKKLIFILSWLPALASANPITLCLEGDLFGVRDTRSISGFRCTVDQKLTWDDSSGLFTCEFRKSNEEFFVNEVTIGSDLGSNAWVYYDLFGTDLARFLTRGLGLKTVTRAQRIRVNFADKVWANDKFVVIEADQKLFKFYVSATLGDCSGRRSKK